MFADEPTGNLDSATGADVLTLLRHMVTTYGQTTVMVTHDPRAAAIAAYRWVRRFTPLFADAARPLRHAAGDRWFVGCHILLSG